MQQEAIEKQDHDTSAYVYSVDLLLIYYLLSNK